MREIGVVTGAPLVDLLGIVERDRTGAAQAKRAATCEKSATVRFGTCILYVQLGDADG